MSWYYAQGAARQGPVSEGAFAELVRTGVISDSTLVWRDTMADWQPYGAVKAVAEPVAASAAPSDPGLLAFCSNCGKQVAAAGLVTILGRRVCGECKMIVLQQVREGAPAATARVYGGFWIRFAAQIIDVVILGAIQGVLSAALGSPGEPGPEGNLPPQFWRVTGIVTLLGFVAGMAYQAFFLPSRGATPGKMVFGLRVIRPNGDNLTPLRAIGRYWAHMINAFTFGIGYIMAAWDSEKRGLHDRIADTRVIRG